MSKRCPYKTYTYAREFKLEALGWCKTQIVQRLHGTRFTTQLVTKIRCAY